MFGYFKIQLKRFIKISPFVLAVALILFVGIGAVYMGFTVAFGEDTSKKPFKIGVSGDTDNKYFDLGFSALTTLDSSRFSIELEEMDEDTAHKKLMVGEIAAYIVMPDGFVSAAMKGEVLPIRYVTGAGNAGLVTMFKDEITKVVEDIVKASQKGTFSLENALRDNGGSKKYISNLSDDLSIEYVHAVIVRNGMYRSQITGVSSGLDVYSYLACGISVLFIMLSGLVYSVVLIRRDNAMPALLKSRGYRMAGQVGCEFSALFVSFFPIVALIGIAVCIIAGIAGFEVPTLEILFSLIPAVMLSCACNLFLFELCDRILTGVLVQFFATLFMSYFSGCLYPIYSLPTVLQRAAPYLPTGRARMWLESVLLEEADVTGLLGVLGYTLAFLVLASLVREARVRRKI